MLPHASVGSNRTRVGVDISDITGHTPLMEAASNGHTHIVLLLMNAGASVALKDRSGIWYDSS